MRGQLHSVVGDELVDVAVLVAFGLRVADQNDHLPVALSALTPACKLHKHTRGFPILDAGARWTMRGGLCEVMLGDGVYVQGRLCCPAESEL
jgi:hypothetical protein